MSLNYERFNYSNLKLTPLRAKWLLAICAIILLIYELTALSKAKILKIIPPKDFTVEVQEIKQMMHKVKVRVPCLLKQQDYTHVVSRTTGVVHKINYKNGDLVEKDAVVITILPETQTTQISSAIAALKYVQKSHEIASRLAKDKYGAQLDLDKISVDLAKAKQELETAKLNMQFTEIKAPFTGTISDINNLSLKMLVNPNSPLFTIHNSQGKAMAEAYVNSKDYRLLKIGDECTLELNAPGLKGTVYSKNPSAVKSSGDCLIEIAIDNYSAVNKEYQSSNPALDVHNLCGYVTIAGIEKPCFKVQSSDLSINEEGKLLIKCVDENNKVIAYEAEVIDSNPAELYILAAAPQVKLITVGQGFVNVGEIVKVSKAETTVTENSVESKLS